MISTPRRRTRQSAPTRSNRTEGGELFGDVLAAREADAGGRGEVPGDSEHGHASLLDLHLTELVKLLLGLVGEEAQGGRRIRAARAVVVVVVILQRYGRRFEE